MSTAVWDASHPPFSFSLDGRSSTDFLSQWLVEATVEEVDEGTLTHYRYADPAGGLVVTAHVLVFAAFPAVDWVLEFTNTETANTPILSEILPLDTVWAQAQNSSVILHHAKGSLCVMDDFQPLTDRLYPGSALTLAPIGGRSSNGTLPFMNLQGQNGGMVLAIGWSGQWSAQFTRDEQGVGLRAGDGTHAFVPVSRRNDPHAAPAAHRLERERPCTGE